MKTRLHTIDHLRRAAKARLPRVVFDFMDGGAGREDGLRRNIAAYEPIRLVPRVLVNCETRSISKELFGRRYAAPFGVAPIGFANMIWPGNDLALARAAAVANIPYTLSTLATTTIEQIAKAAPNHAWFQLYAGRDQAIVDDLIDRADAAKFDVMFVTVDAPAPGKRIRDLVNGIVVPPQPSLRTAIDLALHPSWGIATLRAGLPSFANYARYAGRSPRSQSHASLMASQISAGLDWEMLAKIRQRWPRRLLIKGILNPGDARRAADAGVDGIVISNHGGRQLDSAPASIEVLPAVRRAVGNDIAVLMDGGIRTGEDLAKALALGADFVLLGRAFLYGVGALGPVHGPAATLSILKDELDRTLAQLGCADINDLSDAWIWRAPG